MLQVAISRLRYVKLVMSKVGKYIFVLPFQSMEHLGMVFVVLSHFLYHKSWAEKIFGVKISLMWKVVSPCLCSNNIWTSKHLFRCVRFQLARPRKATCSGRLFQCPYMIWPGLLSQSEYPNAKLLLQLQWFWFRTDQRKIKITLLILNMIYVLGKPWLGRENCWQFKAICSNIFWCCVWYAARLQRKRGSVAKCLYFKIMANLCNL